VATYLNVFVRMCRSVRMANLAQLVNVIAPIFTSPDGLFRQTIFHPLHLFARHVQAVALDPTVVCDTFTHVDPPGGPRPQRIADLGPFKLLDVAATRDADGHRVVLTVVNRSPDAGVTTTVSIGRKLAPNSAVVHIVNGPSPVARNSFAEPDLVGVRTHAVPVDGAEMELTFPPHSFTCVELQLQ